MANFTLALSAAVPGLDISYATGEKIQVMMTSLAYADPKLLKSCGMVRTIPQWTAEWYLTLGAILWYNCGYED